jgi:hypothetical protein
MSRANLIEQARQVAEGEVAELPPLASSAVDRMRTSRELFIRGGEFASRSHAVLAVLLAAETLHGKRDS